MSDWTKAQYNSDVPDDKFQQIYTEYKQSLELLSKKRETQFLLCPVGLIGAGKTTVVKPLSEKLGIVRISTDEIRELLKHRGYNYNRAHDIAYQILTELVENGYSIAFDANCGTVEAQEKLHELEERYNVRLFWVHVNPPEQFILEKLRNYPHTWLFEGSDEAIASYYRYKETYGDFFDLPVSYVYTFDTSKANLNQQIEEAFIRIKEML
ncbi:MAG: hypothetical protein G01um101470_609 [Parcubacteria group bacterium Gr01-1014_70]|nr:MAG: hypothetical protein G01um101470_609 [Parcubacteria group bacterium Gr01-1014_70]